MKVSEIPRSMKGRPKGSTGNKHKSRIPDPLESKRKKSKTVTANDLVKRVIANGKKKDERKKVTVSCNT